MIDVSGMFDDTVSGMMKKAIFLQEARFKLTHLTIDKCLQGRTQIDGDILINVLTLAFTDDFFLFDTQEGRYEFIFFYVAQLMASGILSRQGKHGKTLSFKRDEDEVADLRRETQEAVKKYLEPEKLENWLVYVARLYSEGEEAHAMRDKKESTLN